jgi:ATP/maltotriose-dependent transcriptional regulator MalT
MVGLGGTPAQMVERSSMTMVIRVLALLGAGFWSVVVLGVAVALAPLMHGAWVALVVATGLAPPVIALMVITRVVMHHEQARRALPGPADREAELLRALEERGELTPVTAAMRTSLSVEEAAAKLDELATKGYLQMELCDGVIAYSLYARDRSGSPGPSTEHTPPEDAPRAAFSANGSRNGAHAEDEDRVYEPLSERELEVLGLLASGRSNAEIARDLVISVGTVKTHTNNIYRKLGARNRAEALARARRLHLV